MIPSSTAAAMPVLRSLGAFFREVGKALKVSEFRAAKSQTHIPLMPPLIFLDAKGKPSCVSIYDKGLHVGLRAGGKHRVQQLCVFLVSCFLSCKLSTAESKTSRRESLATDIFPVANCEMADIAKH